jgi:hypothetical protein
VTEAIEEYEFATQDEAAAFIRGLMLGFSRFTTTGTGKAYTDRTKMIRFLERLYSEDELNEEELDEEAPGCQKSVFDKGYLIESWDLVFGVSRTQGDEERTGMCVTGDPTSATAALYAKPDHAGLSAIPKLLAAQFVEQCVSLFEIGSIEPLGEPVVDFGEHRARLVAAAFSREQPGETHRRAQLPCFCAHAAGER